MFSYIRKRGTNADVGQQCCGPKLFFFSGSGSYLDLNFESGSGFFIKKYIRNSDNLNTAKKPDCFEKFI
jgi:hypothetical protein